MELLSLREVQLAELDILLTFDAFCKEHGLRYSLDGGTLIGAVRHKGFIPWDDDIDVCMPRPDYDRFLSLCRALPSRYDVITFQNSKWPQPFAKIQDKHIRAQEPMLQGVMDEYLWIDIFPFDGFIDDPEKFSGTFGTIRGTVEKISRSTYKAAPEASLVKRFAKASFVAVNDILPVRKSLKKQLANSFRALDYGASDRVFCYANQFEQIVLPKAGFEEAVSMEFEGYMLPCMSCWDECLTLHYGDYMWIPPENERQTHYLKAWRVETEDLDGQNKGGDVK